MPQCEAKGMEIKAVSNDGVFEGYLSRFNEPDLEEDIVAPGAFTKSLKTKGPTRPMLWQHSAWEPVGILNAKEDDQGLFIQGHLNLEVQRAREAHSLIKQRAVTGLSQGFMPVKADNRPEGRGRILKELDLWEGSLATFPALPSAQIMAVRAALPPWMRADPAAERREATLKALAGIARSLVR